MAFPFLKKAEVRLPVDKEIFLSLLAGLESGVATTTAIIIGLLISERIIPVVIVAALVTISVQAFNSAASRYTSLRTSEEIEDQTATEKFGPTLNAILQFFAHASASLIPMIPLFFLGNAFLIVITSITLAYLMLIIIGGFQGIFLNVQTKENMIELLATGTLVMMVGVIAGFVLR